MPRGLNHNLNKILGKILLPHDDANYTPSESAHSSRAWQSICCRNLIGPGSRCVWFSHRSNTYPDKITIIARARISPWGRRLKGLLIGHPRRPRGSQSSSLRSKRFRLVSEQRNTEEGDFRFWPRQKWNESQILKEGGGEGWKRLQTNP